MLNVWCGEVGLKGREWDKELVLTILEKGAEWWYA
jgi:hypothetical protein